MLPCREAPRELFWPGCRHGDIQHGRQIGHHDHPVCTGRIYDCRASTLPVEKTRETCTVKVVQKDTDAKTVGSLSDTSNTNAGFTAGAAGDSRWYDVNCTGHSSPHPRPLPCPQQLRGGGLPPPPLLIFLRGSFFLIFNCSGEIM